MQAVALPSHFRRQIETHVDGERVRYFQDDDNVGLKEMVRREKMSSAQDQNALYSRMAAKVRANGDGVPGGFPPSKLMHLYCSFVCVFSTEWHSDQL